MKKIAVIDYGMGNLHSVMKALEYTGVPAVLTCDPKVIEKSCGIILPGVGAFKDAMKEIKKRKLQGVLTSQVKAGKPILGICLGMQLLFSLSTEFGSHKGLGFIKGRVVRFKKGMKVPHMGWNRAEIANNASRIFRGMKDDEYFYFVHSYYVVPSSPKVILTKTGYGNTIFTSSVEQGNVFGFQFHPEKSGERALKVYRNFYDICLKTH
ncbi:MAG: imidazole glycerol phosphate synthase subunit HisH [Spirochaetia bacterium]|nr:imidazole glycerol phosphate synthase subunit HisH [Spirochaetia bacterium]